MIPAVLVASFVLLFPLARHASADVGAYPEPTFTKTSGNNAYWFHWTAVTGVDSNGATDYRYYLCLSTYHNGVQEEFSNGTIGPGSANCTAALRSGPTPASGNNGFSPYTSGTVLQDGHRYDMCASGWRLYVFVWSSDNAACASTVIDRNKPTLGVTVANGADVTNIVPVPVSISYSDATSPPWNGSNGYASNWVCIQQDGGCVPGGEPNTDCSSPTGGFGNRINSFACGMGIGGGDGSYHFCTFGADAAVPDNPSGTNQFQTAFSNNANLSDVSCDSVIVDRAGPSVRVTVNASSVTVGELVSFSMSASDPNGLSGAATWDFGDNSAQAAGTAATHTYTQAGTYVVKVTQTDAAGNAGAGAVRMTVNLAGGGGTVTPGTSQGTSGATPIAAGVTLPQLTDEVRRQSGGGGTRTVSVGALDLVAPKRFVAGKRTMLLACTVASAGSLKVAFLKRSKILARKGATFGGPGTYKVRVKMPKKLRPGSYKLKVTFKAAGAAGAKVETLTIKVRERRQKRGARRSGTQVERLGGTPAAEGRASAWERPGRTTRDGTLAG
jgi:hypothetical protein